MLTEGMNIFISSVSLTTATFLLKKTSITQISPLDVIILHLLVIVCQIISTNYFIFSNIFMFYYNIWCAHRTFYKLILITKKSTKFYQIILLYLQLVLLPLNALELVIQNAHRQVLTLHVHVEYVQ